MGLFKGGALRLLQTFFYFLAFCCVGIITGIYGYFLAVLADRDLPIATKWKAVIGMAGVGTLYTIFAILLTCCLAGKTFFSFIGLLMDILLIGAMIAIAILTREGRRSCSGSVNTPVGSGPSDSSADGFGANGFGFGDNANATYAPNLGLACRLQKTVFIVACIGAFIFLVTALMQIFLVRHHKKEQRFGPSPDNNYTSGTTRKFYQRKPKTEKDVEIGNTAPVVIPAVNQTVRPSHDTAYTGETVAAPAGNRFLKKEVEPVAPVHNTNNYNDIHNGSSIYARMPEEPTAEHAPHVGWTPHNHLADQGYASTTPARNF